jgi:ABC-type phosphate transport system substrate-binding protein
MTNKWIVLLGLCLSACTNFDYQSEGKDVPTAGKITIWADFGDSLMLTQMTEVFVSKYPKAFLQFKFTSETEILKAVNSGICRVCILHRDLNAQEKEALENRSFKVRSAKFARSSIALVTHKNSSMDVITETELKQSLSGNAANNNLKWVFDRLGGNNYMYFYRRFKLANQTAGSVVSMPNPYGVLDWVIAHPGSIGFVGINVLADKSDTLAMHYQRKVKILRVLTDTTKASYPFQSQIFTRQYPYTQDVFIHDLQGYSGLGSGLAAWLCSQPGQIMVKKSGLLPCFDAGRTVEVNTQE